MPLPKPHAPRPLAFLGLLEPVPGWRVKLYSISESGDPPGGPLRDRTEALVRATVERHAVADAPTYGVGFAAIHEATLFNQVIVDWWARDNELRHRVHRAWPDAPHDFDEVTATGEAFCVWELALLAHEREAWLRHVLQNPAGPDYDAYLADRLEGMV